MQVTAHEQATMHWEIRGRNDERHAIVAWLRQLDGTAPLKLITHILANAIERGEHEAIT